MFLSLIKKQLNVDFMQMHDHRDDDTQKLRDVDFIWKKHIRPTYADLKDTFLTKRQLNVDLTRMHNHVQRCL